MLLVGALLLQVSLNIVIILFLFLIVLLAMLLVGALLLQVSLNIIINLFLFLIVLLAMLLAGAPLLQVSLNILLLLFLLAIFLRLLGCHHVQNLVDGSVDGTVRPHQFAELRPERPFPRPMRRRVALSLAVDAIGSSQVWRTLQLGGRLQQAVGGE